MQTYLALKQQIAELEKKADEARQAEVAQALAQVKELITLYGLSARDLGFSARPKGQRSSSHVVGIPKYRDPKTGRTWTGRGKPPTWIATKKNRDEFLLDKPAAPKVSNAGASSKRKSASALAQKAA